MRDTGPATSGRIVVVGIGADGMIGLAPTSRAELAKAAVIHGSPRQLDLLDGVTAVRRAWPSPLAPALRTLLDDAPSGGDVHVLASGDPMLHGVGTSLVRLHGANKVTVLPHVSSVTLACARLGWARQDIEVISLVTGQAATAVRRGGHAVVLSRDGSTPAKLAALLTDTGRGASELTVLEQLGGPAEARHLATAREWAGAPRDFDPLNVIAVRYLPDDRLYAVLPDDALGHDGQLTKQSIRAVTLAALAPRPGEMLWDVGAGSGSVAVEWCRSGTGCTAVAFERNDLRRTRMRGNVTAFGVPVEVRGAAPGGFDGAATPSAIFVGGGATQPGLLDACLDRLPDGGRLVANAVTAESEAVLVQWYSKRGGQLRRYQHYLGEPVGSFTGWRPAMPVTQWAVTT